VAGRRNEAVRVPSISRKGPAVTILPYRHPCRQSVLVVADDRELIGTQAAALQVAGLQVAVAGTGAEALVRIAERPFDLVIVDVAVRGVDRLRRGHPDAGDRPPVLFLAGCDALDGILPDVAPGRADYVTKPCRTVEVIARARVLLRGRNPGRAGGALSYGDLVLDDAVCQVRRGQRTLDLTPGEYRLLRQLLVNPGTVLSKERIARYVWGEFRGDNAIERLVSRLRHKVDFEGPALLHTRRGFGYRLGDGPS
jgi:two-component system, OmpR family, response regulator